MLDIHVVSHTHWDREWYLAHEQFRFRLVALIDRLLDLLGADPSYKHFHLDGQTIVLEDYLEIRPDQEPRLRRAIESGRVLIGPWYDMPDEFLVSGESLVRNLARGHRISRGFGAPMPVGYLPDLFGHVGQMPQIWRQFGIDNTILWRGFGGPQAEYWWEAPDGSRVLMMHLPPEGYCNATRIAFDPAQAMTRAMKAVDYERHRTRVGQALLMNGVDHVEPHAAIPALVDALSSVPGQRAMHSTLPAYVAAVRTAVERERPELDIVRGELRSGTEYANLLPGVLSARIYLKQQNALVQTMLESYAEPLSVFAMLAGGRYPAGELRHAWKTLLQNHPHDSICGCSIDAVHEENMIRFARARQVAGAVIDTALETIADSVAAPAPGSVRALVVNPDVVEKAQVVDALIDLPVDSAEPWRVVDSQALDRPVAFWPADASISEIAGLDGRSVPFQLLAEQRVVSHVMSRYETPWALNVRRLHVLWWAPSIPPCGYAAFDLRITDSRSAKASASAEAAADKSAERATLTVTPSSAENEHLRLSLCGDGTFEVTDKATGTVYHGVAALEDVGDVGDEYNYCPPASDRIITSRDARVVAVERIAGGPLRAAFRVALELPIPRAAAPGRQQRAAQTVVVPVTIDASLDAGSPRVDFSITVDNRAADHRLRILFPTGAPSVDRARADSAFDIVARLARQAVPERIVNEAPVSSAPMISLVDAGDASTGTTVFARGLAEYEIVGDRPAIALTLMRAVGDLSRNDLTTRPSGHAGPPVQTPGAQCPGVHRYEIAFQPHAAPPGPGTLMSAGRAFTVAPMVVQGGREDAQGPASRSFLRMDCRGDVVLSAIKEADDRRSIIVRLFNPGDSPSEARIAVDAHISEAHFVNFLEERQSPIPVQKNAASVRLGPHQIQTIEMAL